MSTFGYRRELSKYESIDEDELLASLTDEELKELERELEDIEPDRNLPVGQRQKNLTEKTPTGTFSREALMAYWEKETRKLLEKERLGACEKDSKQEDDNSEDTEEEYFTGTNSEISEEAYTEEEEEEEEEEEKEEEEENEEEENDEDDSEKKEKAEACEQIVNCESGRSSDHSKHKKFNSQKEKENVINGDGGKDTEDMSFKTGAIHPCGNPTVIEDALEKVRNNDPDTTEVNLNNIENITIQMLTHFAQALKNNTMVKMFSLANTRADDNAAIAIAGMLKVNQHITSLNIDSNFITGKGILAIMRALQHNKVLTELRFHNQRHIMGSQVEMDIAKLLKDNTNVVKLGYHFELAGPRMSMTSILTRNMDKQRQKRMQEQKQQEPGCDGAINPKTKALQKGTPGSSPYTSPKSSPWSSPKLPKKAQPVKSQPPAPPPPPPSPPPLPPLIVPEKKAPTRSIAEVIKQQESSKNALQNGHKKKKGKKSKKYENSILKEIKNSLKSVSDKKSEEESRPSTRPSTPQMSLHDSLMEAIRGSSMKQLKRAFEAQRTIHSLTQAHGGLKSGCFEGGSNMATLIQGHTLEQQTATRKRPARPRRSFASGTHFEVNYTASEEAWTMQVSTHGRRRRAEGSYGCTALYALGWKNEIRLQGIVLRHYWPKEPKRECGGYMYTDTRIHVDKQSHN